MLNKLKEKKEKIKIAKLRKQLEPEIEKLMIKNHPDCVNENGKFVPFLGSCHEYWNYEKDLLKEKYDIDWKIPAEERLDVLFD